MRFQKSCVLALTLIATMPGIASAVDDSGPPLALLAPNIASTPYTAVVEITAVEWVNETHGYITFKVQAKVDETIKGKDVPQIEYWETHEAPSDGPRPGSRIMISLDRAPDGRYVVPDNGYVFPASDAVLALARKSRASKHRH